MRLIPVTLVTALLLTGTSACTADDVAAAGTLDRETACAEFDDILTQVSHKFTENTTVMLEAGGNPAKAPAAVAGMADLYRRLGKEFEKLATQTADSKMKALLTEASTGYQNGAEAIAATGSDTAKAWDAVPAGRPVNLLRGLCNP